MSNKKLSKRSSSEKVGILKIKTNDNKKVKSLQNIPIKSDSYFYIVNINKEWNNYGNTMTPYYEGNNLCFLIIGGNDKDKKLTSNFLYKYSTTTQEFTSLELQIKQRYFHTTNYYNGKFYVFGGRFNGYYNEIYEIDLEKMDKKLLDVKLPPSKRYGHSSIIWKNQMIVFAGYDEDGMFNNDLYTFDFIESTWNSIEVKNKPFPRVLHSCKLIEDKMYIFGGKGSKHNFNDLWYFDLNQKIWYEIKILCKLNPSYGHFIFSFKNLLFIFGGKDEDMKNIFVYNYKESTSENRTFQETFFSDNPEEEFDPFTGTFHGNIHCNNSILYLLGGIKEY